MNGYLTPDGFYYEAPAALGGEDLEVPVRPHGPYRFDLSRHEWVPHRSLSADNEHHTPQHTPATRHHQSGGADAGSTDMLSNIRLTLKDMIQVTFAALSLVSIYYALKQDMQSLHYELSTLREQSAVVERHLSEHNSSEVAHYRLIQDLQRRIRDLETETAPNRRLPTRDTNN